MGKKYLTLSFDDGLEQDRKITKILRKYHLSGCTFNLNAGMFGEKAYIGRIQNYGIKVVPGDVRPEDDDTFCYYPSNRLPKEDIQSVYEGFEVAGHGLLHPKMSELSREELQESIGQELKILSDLVGYPIVGYAYPFGDTSDQVVDALKEKGIWYARLVMPSEDFKLPEDPWRWNMTSMFISPNLFDKLDEFIEADAEEDLFFSAWGHGYEFDFGTEDSNWERLEKFCETVSEHREIICCTNRDFITQIAQKKSE